MGLRIAAVVAVFVLVSLGWLLLGASIEVRTASTHERLHEEVEALWGEPHSQVPPELVFRWKETTRVETPPAPGSNAQPVPRETTIVRERPVLLAGSDVRVDLALDQRRKGLLWYSLYMVDFEAAYRYVHELPQEGELVITWLFPARQTTYDDFRFDVAGGGEPTFERGEAQRIVRQVVPVGPRAEVPFTIGYRSRGLDAWRYAFGSDVSRVRDFRMVMTTDFDRIDYPQGTISPDLVERTAGGWRLVWESDNLISGFHIGMEMPHRLNPGPLASRIAFFAPVCLGFFFVWIFVITLFRGIDLHPVNYLFLAAAFFSFHLLLAYTVDHIPLVAAFVLSSVVSAILVVSYLRLVVGLRFAAVEAGLSHLVYLVLFSSAHFFEGFTGLVVSVGSILTLFVLMQLTGRTDWGAVFQRGSATAAARSSP